MALSLRDPSPLRPFLTFVAVLSVFAIATPARAQESAVERESYEVWLCPIHRDEQSNGPDQCPVCDRDMVQRLLVPSYSCPMHQHVDEETDGDCPVCNMRLVATTRELQWFCVDQPEVVSAGPGSCPSGVAMQMRSIPMAHGDHNPKHGGILFMAPNGYNHLEGTLDEDGTFRLYLYDDFTKPVDAASFTGRVDDQTLSPAPSGEFLTAKLGTPGDFPSEHVAFVRFPSGHEDESRFDFIFVESMVRRDASAEDLDEVLLPEFRVPDTPDGIHEAILVRNERIRELIEQGFWADLYIPALEAKDLVLALAEQEPDRVAVAAKRLVRASWLLDVYGDIGNRVEVERAYEMFSRSIRELEDARAR